MQAHEPVRCDSSESDEGIDRSFLDFSPSIEKTKIFHDNVHSHLELPSICCRIINTPQFQRLRNLKQVGLCYHVYPSAAHNRFEHCIGTSFLAGKYAKILRQNQPELQITDEDVLCLYIGGLCHDIGHGPFSHTWENFMHAIGNTSYSHENMSLKMLDYMIEDNKLRMYFEQNNLTDKDLTFIKELILGHPLPKNGIFIGRQPCKHFLYQIVSNDRTKIDVDKFDYILRDCKQLNITTTFDYQRVLANSRVIGYENGETVDFIEDDTPTIIVYRKKICDSLEELFRGRFSMHHKAYQHRVTKVIEEMVLDGLKAAEPYFKVTASNGVEYKLSNAWQDISAFMKLTDSVFEMICHWNAGGTQAADIFERVLRRDVYTFLGYFTGEIEPHILSELQRKNPNLRLISTKINFGNGKRNPLNEVLFYEKSRPKRLISNKYRDEPEERRTFIYDCTTGEGNEKHEKSFESSVQSHAIRKTVNQWAGQNNITLEYE